MNYEITEDQIIWLANHIDENDAGKILISTYVVNKFRKFIHDPNIDSVTARGLIVHLNWCWEKRAEVPTEFKLVKQDIKGKLF